MTVNVKNDYAKLSFFNWYSGEKNRDSIKNHYKYGCNKDIPKHQRMNCGALLQMDSWEIKDDYPWRQIEFYDKNLSSSFLTIFGETVRLLLNLSA